MDGSGLLANKRAPPARIALALGLFAIIFVAVFGALSLVSVEIEEHYHIFHPKAKKVDDHDKSAGLFIFLILLYPLLTALGLVLAIPLLVYVSDYAPFQNLNLLRPNHYAKLLKVVYTTWLNAEGGKLKSKDL